jgi:hypothetical protein
MATGAIIARILTQYSNKGSKQAQKDIKLLSKTFGDFGRRSAKAFGIATAASAAFAIKIGKDAVQAAIADQKSQALLANTLRNTTGATESAIAGVENYVTALQKQFNVVDDEIRPAMARLVGLTGSVTQAQALMQTALNVSAKSGADLATSTGAVIKATSGQFKAIKNLVPELSLATIKSKNVAKAFEEINKASAGAAATRANTLEYRLKGLQIAFGEILETLGYALLPIMEKFANVISREILPKLEAFITTNKDKLAASFTLAANAAVALLTASINFANWIANNMGLVKTMGILIAGMFITSKVYAMITAVNLLTAAFVRMNFAMGAGAIGAITKTAAKGGIFATAGVALAGGAAANNLGGYLASLVPGTKAYKQKTAGKVLGGNLPMSPSPSDITSGRFNTGSSSSIGGEDAFAAFLKALNLNTAAITKKTKFDLATERAMKELAARQKGLSGSSSIAIGGPGSNAYGPRGNTTVVVNNAGSVITEENLVTSIVNGIERTTRRSFGSTGAFDR